MHGSDILRPHPPQGRPRRTPDNFAAEVRARRADHPAEQSSELSETTQVSDEQVIARAQEAANRLVAGASWQDWLAVGRALRIGRAHAMYEAGTNQPTGSRYAACFGRWLAAVKLDKVADKATRSRLFDLLDNLDAVEKWHQSLPTNRRLAINHPNTVWRHWQRSKVVPDPNKPRPPSPVTKLKQSLAEIEEENARLKQLNGGNTFTGKDTARDVVRVLRATFTENKLAEIRRLRKAEVTS